MLRIIIFLFCFLSISKSHPQKEGSKETDKDISAFSSSRQYEESILRLEKIILNEKSSADQLYDAYFQKYLIYKKLFNYTAALTNLDLALEVGIKGRNKEEAKIKIAVERMFIHFDLLEFDKVTKLLATINRADLKLLSPETEAFYLSVVGTMMIRSEKYKEADEYLNEALVLLLKHAPRHLPLVYRKKIGLHKGLKQYKEAVKDFEKGLYYAEKYQIDVYIIAMYSDMSHFYSDIGDIENALRTQQILNKLATDYDNTNISGKLHLIEKELLVKQKEEKSEKSRLYFISFSLVLLLVLTVIYFYYRSNRNKWRRAEIENARIRAAMDKMILEIKDSGPPKAEVNHFNFTERQLEIIKLVKMGKTNKEIGTHLFISENTVKYHLKIIYETLKINNRRDL